MENPHAELAPIQEKLHLADCLLQANCTHESLINLQMAAAEGKASWSLEKNLLLYSQN